MQTFNEIFKFQEQTWGHQDSQQNVSAIMYLVPVIQLEIEITRTSCRQILRRQLHLTECRPTKTLSKSKKWTWGCWDSQQNVSDKLYQVNQAAAYRVLLGGFALLSWVQKFNTVHSCSQANALLYACHRFSIAAHHRCLLMKMITCLQCNWLQFVVRYLALLNE